MADQRREIARLAKATERIVEWVGEARSLVADGLTCAKPAGDLVVAQRRLGRAAESLVRVDRERAVEETDIALRKTTSSRGDEALICRLVHDALAAALGGQQPPAAIARPALRVAA